MSLINVVILQVRLCFLWRSFAVHGWSVQQACAFEDRLRLSVAQEISLGKSSGDRNICISVGVLVRFKLQKRKMKPRKKSW
jgi:hypothetical protein